LARKDSNLK